MTINQLEMIHLHDMSFSSSSGHKNKSIDYEKIKGSGELIEML